MPPPEAKDKRGSADEYSARPPDDHHPPGRQRLLRRCRVCRHLLTPQPARATGRGRRRPRHHRPVGTAERLTHAGHRPARRHPVLHRPGRRCRAGHRPRPGAPARNHRRRTRRLPRRRRRHRPGHRRGPARRRRGDGAQEHLHRLPGEGRALARPAPGVVLARFQPRGQRSQRLRQRGPQGPGHRGQGGDRRGLQRRGGRLHRRALHRRGRPGGLHRPAQRRPGVLRGDRRQRHGAPERAHHPAPGLHPGGRGAGRGLHRLLPLPARRRPGRG